MEQRNNKGRHKELLRFYNSKAWKTTRELYKLEVNGICERCIKASPPKVVPGMIVHHKIYLNKQNVNDIDITLNFNNLELLCLDCHNKEHFKTSRSNNNFNDKGEFIENN